jgi:hypothetical protein
LWEMRPHQTLRRVPGGLSGPPAKRRAVIAADPAPADIRTSRLPSGPENCYRARGSEVRWMNSRELPWINKIITQARE